LSDLLIRDAKPSEVKRLVEIALAAWEPIYAWYRQTLGDEIFLTAFPDWHSAKGGQIRAAFSSGSRAMIAVAEIDGEVAGFITFYANDGPSVGRIGNNAVDPRYQNRGIATRLYQHVFARLKEMGMRVVRVTTGGDPSHAPARRAYEKAGFSLRVPHVEYYREL
jgi:ribosomal protein S18 acetylase RimI-like enzyme